METGGDHAGQYIIPTTNEVVIVLVEERISNQRDIV